MIRRVFTKLFLSFVLVLAVGTTALDLALRGFIGHALAGDIPLLRRDLLIASLIAVGLALVISAILAQRASARLNRIVAFAHRIAAGDFAARFDEGSLDEISDVAHALDATAVRLESTFKELDSRRRELAALLDSMQEAVIAVDGQSRIAWSNAVMRRIAPAAAREGAALAVALRDPGALACVENALASGKPASGKATSVVPGSIFDVNAAPMPGGGAVAVLHDVTGVARADQMRRDFVANVSHELRTPLTSISGYVETLLDGPEEMSDSAREFLSIILKNSTRMSRLTEDLLTLAGVESGNYKLTMRPVPAARLVEDSVHSFAGMVMDLDVALEPDETTLTQVLADEDALTQVFGNLIENAVKYGRDSRRVLVGARDVDEAVEFYVRDFGPGIASEHLDRIFERFYRVDKARSRESGGTGLGLAIARHIVLAHGGTIRVESELGAGATFLFTLPKSAEDRAQLSEHRAQTFRPEN